jgi:hypothetical protein
MARHFGGWLQLGIRPFDDPGEHWAWQPGLDDAGGDPIWWFSGRAPRAWSGAGISPRRSWWR